MSEPHQHPFELSGGQLALDFVNTVGGMRGEQPKEHLRAYEDLLAFAVQTGSVSGEQARALADEARLRPADAEAALGEARAIREALYRVVLAPVEARPVAAADLELLNAALGRALSHRRLAAGEDCCALGWDSSASLDAPWWASVAAAADLLAARDELARVRVCGMSEAGECGWLFVDRTKARTRRWCSMADCGNRAKARRHYAKVKKGE
jgi:predicted RNA-binding Zn ribbon-like protein